jgi:hypothetical protein
MGKLAKLVVVGGLAAAGAALAKKYLGDNSAADPWQSADAWEPPASSPSVTDRVAAATQDVVNTGAQKVEQVVHAVQEKVDSAAATVADKAAAVQERTHEAAERVQQAAPEPPSTTQP